MKSAYEKLDQIACGYRGAQVLFTAVRLGVFEALRRKALAAGSLAKSLGTDPRATRILCDALVALGVLAKRKNAYANSALAREFLLPDAPRSQAALLLHGARLYERWGQLYDVVKTGQPVPRDQVSTGLPGDDRAFAQAMASSGALAARETAKSVDLTSVRTLLDLGGGPGLYALAFARRQPRLQAVVFDTAETLEVAKAHIAKAGLAHRVSVRAGDAFRDDLGGPCDFVFLSNIVHAYSDAENQQLIARAAQALTPGGWVCVKDFILNPTRTSPEKTSLFAVNMLVNTAGGDCYTVAQIKRWFLRAGLAFAGTVKLTPPSQLVLGKKRRG